MNDSVNREHIEDWFIRHGVPHFMDRYSARDRAHVLDLLLFTVLAFEVGVAPWMPAMKGADGGVAFTVQQLLTTPAALVVLALLILSALYRLPGHAQARPLFTKLLPLWLVAMAAVIYV